MGILPTVVNYTSLLLMGYICIVYLGLEHINLKILYLDQSFDRGKQSYRMCELNKRHQRALASDAKVDPLDNIVYFGK